MSTLERLKQDLAATPDGSPSVVKRDDLRAVVGLLELLGKEMPFPPASRLWLPIDRAFHEIASGAP